MDVCGLQFSAPCPRIVSCPLTPKAMKAIRVRVCRFEHSSEVR